MKIRNYLLAIFGAALLVSAFFGFSGKKQALADQSLYFSASQNGTLPSPQNVTVSNKTDSGGEDIVSWQASNIPSWLSVSLTSGGSIPPQTGVAVSFQPNTTSMAPQVYTAVVDFVGKDKFGVDVTGSTQHVSVSYAISTSGVCTINVNSKYNGVLQNPTNGTYNYTISGPSSFSDSGAKSFSQSPSAQNWTIAYTGGTTDYFAGYEPAQSQSCTTNGGSITFTLLFTANPSNPPSNPTGTNSGQGIPCGNIKLSWTASPNATSYTLYRSTQAGNPGSPWQTGVTGTTYTDNTAADNTIYYYWIQGVNAYGSSAMVQFSPTTGIQTIPCVANFSLSNKVITMVNGKTYPFSSSCRISGNSTTPISIKNGDKVTLSINVCNTGQLDAQNVTIIDDLTGTNLVLHNPSGIVLTGGSSRNSSVNGNVLTFTFGTVAAGQNASATFDADVTAPANSTQKLLRFINSAKLSFSTAKANNNQGCVSTGTDSSHPCVLSTGYVVFYNGLKAPTQVEVNP